MRRRASTHALVALLPVLMLVGWPSFSAASSLSFGACPKSTVFSCATLPVPLDRSGALPGTISLSVERRLAAAAPSADAVVALAGGPGQAATPLSEFIAQAISPALSSRDLLVFDQRGTGSSGALSCSALSGAATHTGNAGALVERCAQELGAARGSYTTSESVADIEALREAGGYGKLVLYGTSYGTKVALDYAERYPQYVEALVLDSTETPAGPEAFHLSTFKAMTPALLELCSRGACDGVSTNPVADVARLVARLGKRPLSGIVYDRHGKQVKLSFRRTDLYGLLLAGDLDPALRAEMPAAVHAALAGDPGPLLRLQALGGTGAPGAEESAEVDETLFIDTSCEETPFPWRRSSPQTTRALEAEAALNALPSSAFYPFGPEAALLYQTIPLCVSWPDVSPPPPAEPPLPDVPTLILSGGQDLRTPTEDARAVAKLIPDAQLVTVPYAGHSVIGSDVSGCSQAALLAFFSNRPVSPCPVGADEFPPAGLAPRSLSGLAPASGLQGAAGRTVTASVETIRDLRRTVVLLALASGKIPAGASFGGLRGGSASVTSTSTVLHRLSYVPGVQLSGTIPNELLLKDKGAAANFTVAGPAAAKGHERFSTGGLVAGGLGGQRFTIAIAAAARNATSHAEWPGPSSRLALGALGRLR